MTAEANRSGSGSGSAASHIECLISLTSKYEIRYEGVLDSINESSIGMRKVRSFGTEGRKKDGPQIPPNDKIYEYILFRGSDIKDLQVNSSPVPMTPPIDQDPAIIQSHYSHPPAVPTSFPPPVSGTVTDHSSPPGSYVFDCHPSEQPSGEEDDGDEEIISKSSLCDDESFSCSSLSDDHSEEDAITDSEDNKQSKMELKQPSRKTTQSSFSNKKRKSPDNTYPEEDAITDSESEEKEESKMELKQPSRTTIRSSFSNKKRKSPDNTYPEEDHSSQTSQMGPPAGSSFQAGMLLNQSGGSLGPWGSSPLPPNVNGSGLTMPMYLQGYYPPPTGLSMPPYMQQPMQYPNLPVSSLPDIGCPLLQSSSNHSQPLNSSTLSSNLPLTFSSVQSAVLVPDTTSDLIPNITPVSGYTPAPISASNSFVSPPPNNNFDTTGKGALTSEKPNNVTGYAAADQKMPQLVNPGASSLNRVEAPVPSLVTPSQMLKSGPTAFSSSMSSELAQKDVVQTSPLKPPRAAAETWPPILPLPLPPEQRVMELYNLGTTEAAFVVESGIVIVTDRCLSKLDEGEPKQECTKVRIISLRDGRSLAVTMAGDGWHAKKLVDQLVAYVRDHPELTVERSAAFLMETDIDSDIPRRCAFFVGGYDIVNGEFEKHVFLVDKEGMVDIATTLNTMIRNRCWIGSGGLAAFSHLYPRFHEEMTIAECKDLGIDAVYYASTQDSSTGFGVEILEICPGQQVKQSIISQEEAEMHFFRDNK